MDKREMDHTPGDEILKVSQLDLVFGSRPELAFRELDQGKGREEIRIKTQQVVGVASVSFSVFAGEILVLMGLSGSGKSSLLRCLNGMNGRGKNGVLRGQVLYRDPSTCEWVDISQGTDQLLRSLRRHQMAMVFQQFGLMPWRTVFENVAYPLQIQKLPQKEISERVRSKLSLVGLEPWSHHYPHQLSGGMQQRVGLARAFVTDAAVLLMDEPFSALDPTHRRHLQEEVLRLQQKLKKTILFVTHDCNEAFRVGTRMAVMDQGRILQMDTPAGLRQNPSCEKVKDFLTI